MTPDTPTPRVDAILERGGSVAGICDFARQLEREIAEAKRSPYIDNDEDPVEILAGIYDALDGITDDAANGRNFGTLISRVKAAVQMATELAEVRRRARQLFREITEAEDPGEMFETAKEALAEFGEV